MLRVPRGRARGFLGDWSEEGEGAAVVRSCFGEAGLGPTSLGFEPRSLREPGGGGRLVDTRTPGVGAPRGRTPRAPGTRLPAGSARLLARAETRSGSGSSDLSTRECPHDFSFQTFSGLICPVRPPLEGSATVIPSPPSGRMGSGKSEAAQASHSVAGAFFS